MSKRPDQLTEFQRNWEEQQQKLLSDWPDSVKGADGDSTRSSRRKTTDITEQQVDGTLDARNCFLLSFSENPEGMKDAPEAFNQAVKQREESIDRWAEVQHRMWRVWLDTAPAPQTPGEAAMESWEDTVNQTMAVQVDGRSSCLR